MILYVLTHHDQIIPIGLTYLAFLLAPHHDNQGTDQWDHMTNHGSLTGLLTSKH
ncbi:hypothetical protein [uncultured Litoreibacter sp.]|uniref:hypothetical protein n=1 Tax=uncultured Litoreibacter sp. TaxID=1392394 RepID=UPI00260D8BC6|nr:hypothetical protein [uncultured Litoreibacter sp.]